MLSLQRLPVCFYWDEEGFGVYFEAWPLGDPAGDSPDFHLRIIHEEHEYHWIGEGEDRQALLTTYNMLWVDADLNRETVVEVLLAPVRDFVLYSQQLDNWDISLPDLHAFDQLRARRIPPRSDITHIEPVDLIITRWQDEEEQRGSQYFELRLWDMRVMGWNLDDTDDFWPLWFELLEHALSGRSYEMMFIDIFSMRIIREFESHDTAHQAEVSPDYSARIVTNPLESNASESGVKTRRIRLQIFETDHRYPDFLRVDEIFDAGQLARAFIKEFEDLLAEGYQPYLDEEGQFFDLRQLPLEHLKETLERSVG